MPSKASALGDIEAVDVFVSYAHDQLGRDLAQWLVGQLQDAGLTVHWDRALVTVNPSSIQEWMENRARQDIVVCAISPDYASRFGVGDERQSRKGVLYESRAISLRLHDHTLTENCPVIPVVLADQIHELPGPLRRLLVTYVSFDDAAGITELLTRIRALDNTGGEMNGETAPLHRPVVEGVEPDGRRPEASSVDVRRILSELQERRGEGQLEAVNVWLNLLESGDGVEVATCAEGFPDAEKIAKAAGDLVLMKRISDACLRIARRSEPRLRSELEHEARVLICGEAWYLQRAHELEAGLESIRHGVNLATDLGDRRTEAFGRKCAGRLQRIMAEDLVNDNAAASVCLESSLSQLDTARRLFLALDGEDSEEAGDCLSLEGRAWLVNARLRDRGDNLENAARCADEAEKLIPPAGSKAYMDLVLLKAEVAHEKRRVSEAAKLVSHVVKRLRGQSDAPRSEILARALCVSASIIHKSHPKTGLVQALDQLVEAEEIYTRLGQEHLAADCKWQQVLAHPTRITQVPISREQLDELARQEPNPKRRLDAIYMLNAQEAARVGVTIGRRVNKVNWKPILRKLPRTTVRSRG
ncbi:toll/interleukin-1 receptor domain-containing protein [Fodinicola acaciae]|uniref:toll/interleukin-1 receptor domain-containing protein n=1 Tax=Fodinicola acaciae TaxID=2681555 RepID=UPI0013D65506|nr:toll/interleukin-1 receptor domain-containing protein [Fodinicola acaciae]